MVVIKIKVITTKIKSEDDMDEHFMCHVDTTNYFMRNYRVVIKTKVSKTKINGEYDMDEHFLCHVQHY